MEEHDHHELRVLLGGYVLDQLAPAERRRLEAHLIACSDCRAELDELLPIASGLAAVRGAGGAIPDFDATVPEGLGDRVLASVDAERRTEQHRSWLRSAALAGVAAAAAAAVLVAGLALTRSEPPPTAAPVPLEKVAVTTDEPGLTASADLVAHTWGVEVKLHATGFAAGDRYRVTVLGHAGRRYPAGEFVGTGTREMTCNLNSSVLRERARGFEVRDASGAVVASSSFGT